MNNKVLAAALAAMLSPVFLAPAHAVAKDGGDPAQAPEVKGMAVETPDPRYQLNVWAKKMLEMGPAIIDGFNYRAQRDFYASVLADMGRFAAAKGLADVADAVSAALAHEKSQGFEEGKNTLIAGLIAVMALTEPQLSRREIESRIRAKFPVPDELSEQTDESFEGIRESLRRLRRL